MGGTTFARKGIDTVRLPTEAYQAVAAAVLHKLGRMQSEGFHPAQVVPHCRDKQDFGDLDVVVDERFVSHHGHEAIAAALGATAWSNMGKNDPVLALAVPAWEAHFQVDLIAAADDAFEFNLRYLSWGDAGSLVSAVGRQAGLKFGQFGLKVAVGDECDRRELPASRDFDDALQFLGFDVERHRAGFADMTEVYRWISDSTYFDPAIYQLERLSNAARHRVRRRPGYLNFLTWIADNGIGPNYDWGEKGSRRDEWLPTILERYPEARLAHEAMLESDRRRAIVAAFFNGDAVGRISGVGGERLGHLMNEVQKQLGADLERLALAGDRDRLEEEVRKVAASDYMPRTERKRAARGRPFPCSPSRPAQAAGSGITQQGSIEGSDPDGWSEPSHR